MTNFEHIRRVASFHPLPNDDTVRVTIPEIRELLSCFDAAVSLLERVAERGAPDEDMHDDIVDLLNKLNGGDDE